MLCCCCCCYFFPIASSFDLKIQKKTQKFARNSPGIVPSVPRPDDAPQLDVLPQLYGGARPDPGGEEVGPGQAAEEPDLGEEVLPAAEVDGGGTLLNAEGQEKWKENRRFIQTVFIIYNVFKSVQMAFEGGGGLLLNCSTLLIKGKVVLFLVFSQISSAIVVNFAQRRKCSTFNPKLPTFFARRPFTWKMFSFRLQKHTYSRTKFFLSFSHVFSWKLIAFLPSTSLSWGLHLISMTSSSGSLRPLITGKRRRTQSQRLSPSSTCRENG